MDKDDQILVGEHNGKVFIAVEGRGHFQNSHPMKEYLLARLEKPLKGLVVNLKKCTAMDSTFMGVLAGLAIKLKKKNNLRLKVIQVSPHNRELLDTLGLTQLMDVEELSQEIHPEIKPIDFAKTEKAKIAEHMLEAHQTLSDLSEVNQVKFKNVIEYLKEDLGKKTE